MEDINRKQKTFWVLSHKYTTQLFLIIITFILFRTVSYAIRADKEIKSTVPYRGNTLRSAALHYESLDLKPKSFHTISILPKIAALETREREERVAKEGGTRRQKREERGGKRVS